MRWSPFAVVLGMLLSWAGMQQAALADKDKDSGKEKAEKKDPKAGKEIEGKVKAVDLVKKTLTVAVPGGKDHTFAVTKETKIVGPRGGISKEGLKDDRLAKGMEVKVVPTLDGKTALEIKLHMRARTTPDKEKKEK